MAENNKELVLKLKGDITDLQAKMKAVQDGLKSVQKTTENTTKKGQQVATGFTAGFQGAIKSVKLLDTVMKATIAGRVAQLVLKMVDMGKAQEKFNEQLKALQKHKDYYGDLDQQIERVHKSLRGVVTQQELIPSVSKALALGIDLSNGKFEKMAILAEKASIAMGTDMEDAINDMMTAMGRNSVMIADNLGAVINQEKAQEKYAKSIGKTASELTDLEKKQAFQMEFLTQLEEKYAHIDLTQFQSKVQGIAGLGRRIMEVAGDTAQNFITGADWLVRESSLLFESEAEKRKRLLIEEQKQINTLYSTWQTARLKEKAEKEKDLKEHATSNTKYMEIITTDQLEKRKRLIEYNKVMFAMYTAAARESGVKSAETTLAMSKLWKAGAFEINGNTKAIELFGKIMRKELELILPEQHKQVEALKLLGQGFANFGNQVVKQTKTNYDLSKKMREAEAKREAERRAQEAKRRAEEISLEKFKLDRMLAFSNAFTSEEIKEQQRRYELSKAVGERAKFDLQVMYNFEDKEEKLKTERQKQEFDKRIQQVKSFFEKLKGYQTNALDSYRAGLEIESDLYKINMDNRAKAEQADNERRLYLQKQALETEKRQRDFYSSLTTQLYSDMVSAFIELDAKMILSSLASASITAGNELIADGIKTLWMGTAKNALFPGLGSTAMGVGAAEIGIGTGLVAAGGVSSKLLSKSQKPNSQDGATERQQENRDRRENLNMSVSLYPSKTAMQKDFINNGILVQR